MCEIIKELNSKSAQTLNKIIIDGGILLWPSGGVYGFAADFSNKKAVEKIYEIKKREKAKPLSIIANIRKCSEYAFLSGFARYIIFNRWPDFIGVIVPKKNIPEHVNCGGDYIGLVCSSYTNVWLADYIFRPLASTSANISGEHEITSCIEAEKKFGNEVGGIIKWGFNDGNLNNMVKIN